MQFGGGFGNQDDAHVGLAHVRSAGPIHKGDQIHALIDAGGRIFAGRNEFFRKIDDERDAAPRLPVHGDIQKHAAQKRGQPQKVTRRPLLMKISVLDPIINLQPVEKPMLHFTGAEHQSLANIVVKHQPAIREEALLEESFQRDVSEVGPILHWKNIEDISVQHENGVGFSIPAPGQFQRPGAQGQAGLPARGGDGGRRCGCDVSRHIQSGLSCVGELE